MRKFLTFIFLFATFTLAFASTSSECRLKMQRTAQDYQQFVGKSIVILEPLRENFTSSVKFSGQYNTEYEIVKVESSEIEKYGSLEINTTLSLQAKGQKKIVKYSFSNKSIYAETQSSDIDIILLDKLAELRQVNIGRNISDERFKASYVIQDVFIDIYKPVPDPISWSYSDYCIVKNNANGETLKVNLHNLIPECYKKELEGNYSYFLTKVSRPDEIKDSKEIVNNKGVSCYSDELINIIFTGKPKEINFIMNNSSDKTIKLLWEEAVFVDGDGSSSKITHNGVKLIDRENQLPPTTIISGAKIEDTITPSKNIRWVEDSKNWFVGYIIPIDNSKTSKSIRIMLPLFYNNKTLEYVFTFDIKYVFAHPELLR